MKRVYLATPFLLLLLSCNSSKHDSSISDNSVGKWIKRAVITNDIPSPRIAEAMVWDGNRILIFGGRFYDSNRKSHFFNDLWAYHPVENKWEELRPSGNLPPKLVGSTAVWTGRELLLFGGVNHDEYGEVFVTANNDIWLYDLAKNQWEKLAPEGKKPYKREEASSIWNGSEMVVFCGRDTMFERLHDIWKYNLIENRWSKADQKLPEGMYGGVGDSERIVFSLYTEADSHINRMGVFNLKTNKLQIFESNGISPIQRGGRTLAWAKKKLFLFGGYSGAEMGGGRDNNDLWVYNIENNTWKELSPSGPRPEKRSSAKAVWTGQEIFIFGGHNKHSDYFNDVWSYEPE